MTDITPLTDDELAQLRAQHVRMTDGDGEECCAWDMRNWPCWTAGLLAHIDALTTQLDDIEQCHRNDHARVADLLAEVESLHVRVADLLAEVDSRIERP
jgi:hypothetical protein